MNHYYVHYRNKYPLGRVESREDSLDVYSQNGEHLVALRKNGAGQWVDQSEHLGCRDRHDASPIPKDSRLYKHCPVSGKLIRDEKYEERAKLLDKFADKNGRICSCEELSAQGFDFDDKQRLIREPQKSQAAIEKSVAKVGEEQ